MKHRKILLTTSISALIVMAIIIFCGCLPFNPNGPKGPSIIDDEFGGVGTRYELLFRDDFNTINKNVWKTLTEPRRGGYWDDSQVFSKDGKLVIRTQYREDGPQGAGFYTGAISTRILSGIPFGYYEIKFRRSYLVGTWQAFWIMQDNMGDKADGARNGAELDIFEIWQEETFQTGIHYDGYDRNKLTAKTLTKDYTINDTWRTFAIEWTPDYISLLYDGVECLKLDKPEYISQVGEGEIIFSTEINGSIENGKPTPSRKSWYLNGSVLDNKNSKNIISDFEIEYLKVYKINEKFPKA